MDGGGERVLSLGCWDHPR